MNTKKILGVVAVLALVAVAMVGAGAAASSTTQTSASEASITNDETTTYYDTLQEAVTASTTNDTVVLLKDVSANIEVVDGKTLTIDLAGYTINGGTTAGKATIWNEGVLTIDDSSLNKTGKIMRNDNGTSGYYVIANGPIGVDSSNEDLPADTNDSLTIVSATVYNNTGAGDGSGSSLVRNNGTMVVYNLKFEQSLFIVMKNEPEAVMTINGGEYKSEGIYVNTSGQTKVMSALMNYGTMTVNDGKISGAISVMRYGVDSVLTIKGGQIDVEAIWVNNYNSASEDIADSLVIEDGVIVNTEKILGKNRTTDDAEAAIKLKNGSKLVVSDDTWAKSSKAISTAEAGANVTTSDNALTFNKAYDVDDEKDINKYVEDAQLQTGGNTVVDASVAIKYTVTIPSAVTLGTSAVSADYTITVVNPTAESSKVINMKLTGATSKDGTVKPASLGNYEFAVMLDGSSSSDYMKYGLTHMVSQASTGIKIGDTVVDKDATQVGTPATSTVTYSAVDMKGIKAGSYSDTLTFTVSVDNS